MQQFDSLKEAQLVIEAWRDEYNSFMPPKVNPSQATWLVQTFDSINLPDRL